MIPFLCRGCDWRKSEREREIKREGGKKVDQMRNQITIENII